MNRLEALHATLLENCQQAGGFLPFDWFMHTALYAPNLGYYTSTQPVGSAASGADFTTAPQLSPVFGHTVARALAPCFDGGMPVNLLECGAGTGQLAKDVLDGLALLGIVVQQYSILEVSTSLRTQQADTLKNYPCVEWITALPSAFEGVVLGNELLDAMPVRSFALEWGQVFERGVAWNEPVSAWQWVQRPAEEPDCAVVLASVSANIEHIQQLPRYELERCEQAHAWVASMAGCIKRGALLLIDYGFPRAELYHPQRAGGTLMAHRLHHASCDVLAHAGDADITAHIDFSAVAQAACAQGMALAGYVNQARFLINAGVADVYAAAALGLNTVAQAQLSRSVQLLMSEAEMGELFKVIALTQGCPAPLGFERGDRGQRLILDDGHV